MLFNQEHIFGWQDEFIIDKLLSNGLKDLCLKYLSIHGKDMQNVHEVKQKLAVYVNCEKISEGYEVVVSRDVGGIVLVIILRSGYVSL